MSSEKSTGKTLYTQQRLLFATVDPVHIGTGGYRLGRVDMTIAREPGTNLPKIPGTSLAGATRSYAAMRYGKPEAAGQQKKLKNRAKSCPIIYTFGTALDATNGQESSGGMNLAGTVSIGDAQILFFPVYSMAGPLWVSTVENIQEVWGLASVQLSSENMPNDTTVVTSLEWNKELNLGWLLFEVTKGLTITPPQEVQVRPEWQHITNRLVLTTRKLFSQIVNSNLEVRTSVSISPETGAAEPTALFTYEAIPRATWLWSDVIEDDYKRNNEGTSQFPQTDKQYKEGDNMGESLGETWKRPLDVVVAGMKLIEYLGVGGMGTRGFGRMRCVANWEIDSEGSL